MKFNRIYAIFLRQIYLIRRNPTRLFNIFIWIFVDVVIWGFITRYLDGVANTEFSFIPLLLGAIIFWDFMIRVQQGVMLAFFEDVWSQNFLNLFASPLTVSEYVAGLVITSIVTSSAGLALMLLVAGPIFGFNVFALGTYFLLFILIVFIFGVALGIFSTSIVLRLGPSAEWLAWPIPFLLAPFASVYYPISTLPVFAQKIAHLIPPAYGFEGMRSVLLDGTFLPTQFFIGLVLAIIYLLLAYTFFVRIYRYALKNGLLTRFSSEP
jgi:ABC-2 type transport system permease protein